MNIQKIKIILYYLFLLLPTVCKGFGFDMGDKIYLICAIVSCFLFAIKFLITKWSKKELLIVIPLLLIGLVTTWYSRKFSVMMAILTIVGAKDIDVSKAVKFLSVIWIVCFVSNTTLALTGVIGKDPNCHFPTCTEVNAYAYGLGYGNKNQLAVASVVTLLSYIYLRYEKMKWVEFIPVFLYLSFVAKYAVSDLAVVMFIFVPFLLIFSKIKCFKKLMNLGYKLIVPVCVVFSFVASILYGKFEFMEKLNLLFTTRIELGQVYLKAYPFSLFGSKVETIRGLFLDNGYIYMYCTFGVLTLLLFLIGYQLLIHYLVKNDKAKELLLIGSFLIMGISEQFFTNPFMNISIIFIAFILYENQEKEEVEEVSVDDNKIKVLHIGLSSNHGGLETFVRNVFDNMDRESISFDFIDVSGGNLCFKDYYLKQGCKIYEVTPRKESYFKSFNQLKEIIEKGNYDYIHFHMMIYSWVEPILIANKYSKTKVIVHSHLAKNNKDINLKEKILHRIGKFRIRKKDYLKIACGHLAGLWLFDDKEFKIIENGIDINKFSFNEENRSEIRNKYGIKNNEFVFGHVGNFSYQKNYPYLIKLFFNYQKKNPDSKLLLLGEGSSKEDIKNLVEEYKIEDKVIFAGRVDQAYKYYSAMDAFVFPSFYEGLSIAMVEAQCSGLKCYTTSMVDKACDISGNVVFFDLEEDIDNVVKMIDIKANDQRSLIKIDEAYNITNSSKKMEQYYKDNLVK